MKTIVDKAAPSVQKERAKRIKFVTKMKRAWDACLPPNVITDAVVAWATSANFSPERLDALLSIGTPGLPQFLYNLSDLWACDEMGGGFNHEIDEMTLFLQAIEKFRRVGSSGWTFIDERLKREAPHQS